jgi:hypothetical protein
MMDDGVQQDSTIKLRGTLYGALLGAAVGLLISAALLYFLPGSFLSILIPPIIGFILPYYMGMRNWKHYLLYSIVFIVVLSAVFDASYTHYVFSSSPGVTQDQSFNTTAGYYFGTGNVTPRTGNTATRFLFTVSFYHPANGNRSISVFVVLRALTANYIVNESMLPVSNVTVNGEVKTTYSYASSLNESNIYLMEYQAQVGRTWINSTESVGALTDTPSQTYDILLYPSFIFVLLSIAPLYVGVILIAVLIIQARKRRELLRKKASELGAPHKKQVAVTRAAKKEKFVCSNCGSEVGKDDARCPTCGEKFE